MSAPMVDVKDLCRNFGNVKAVDRISFQIQPGQVVGFIGENGAGKTTTMRMMVTLDLPDSGSIHINGFDTVGYPNEVRKRVGWMPDHYGAYDFMDVSEYMDFFARAYGYEGKEREMRIAEVMDFTELNKLRDRPVKKLSKGQAQRLCLGRTLIPDPELLILDEPAAGLDPRARIEVKNLVRILAGEGKTLFISSHILSELEQMCDDMLFISDGRIVHQGSSESLKVREGQPAVVRIRFGGESAKFEEWITFQEGLALVERDKSGVRIMVENAETERLVMLLRKMIKEDFPVYGFEREDIRLEDAFVDLLNQTEKGAVK
ncbi:ABC transporter ATP-binding protein [Kiritimatiellota bacterium B12222]|nr:ABC transporter ATP-binding protein [Kiritimatiellota bacterium B12222]